MVCHAKIHNPRVAVSKSLATVYAIAGRSTYRSGVDRKPRHLCWFSTIAMAASTRRDRARRSRSNSSCHGSDGRCRINIMREVFPGRNEFMRCAKGRRDNCCLSNLSVRRSTSLYGFCERYDATQGVQKSCLSLLAAISRAAAPLQTNSFPCRQRLRSILNLLCCIHHAPSALLARLDKSFRRLDAFPRILLGFEPQAATSRVFILIGVKRGVRARCGNGNPIASARQWISDSDFSSARLRPGICVAPTLGVLAQSPLPRVRTKHRLMTCASNRSNACMAPAIPFVITRFPRAPEVEPIALTEVSPRSNQSMGLSREVVNYADGRVRIHAPFRRKSQSYFAPEFEKLLQSTIRARPRATPERRRLDRRNRR